MDPVPAGDVLRDRVESHYGCLSVTIEYRDDESAGPSDVLRGCLQKEDQIPLGCETMDNEVYNREINAVTKTNRYLEFVEPFLQLFINPKNGKSMKMKITRLRGKFARYTHRFEKYYYQCGDTSRARRSSSEQKKRVKDYAPSLVSGESQERGFLKEIADTLLLMKAQKTIKENNIGDLSAYECTVENMEHLWHKINAGFRRNFSRYLKGGGSRCSDKVINRLERRLATDERIVSRFIRVHRDWLE